MSRVTSFTLIILFSRYLKTGEILFDYTYYYVAVNPKARFFISLPTKIFPTENGFVKLV